MKLLALDFDGVICDGLREIFLTGYNAYLHFHPDTRILDGCPLTFEFYDEFGGAKRGLFDLFVRLFPFGNKADSQYVILRAIEGNRKCTKDDDFKRFKAKLDPGLLQTYSETFYEERSRLKDMDYGKWLRMYHIYPGMRENLIALGKRFSLAIATSKDKNSVLAILRANRLGNLFPADSILDKEYGNTKDVQIKLFREKFKLDYQDICFVDDRLQVIVPVKNLGVNCYLATWAGSTSEQRKEAKALGIGLLTPDDFVRKLTYHSE
jgi:phosphoglycolate phosphatase-like HAD superfamily hydrolase